jgi:hypothetical protein
MTTPGVARRNEAPSIFEASLKFLTGDFLYAVLPLLVLSVVTTLVRRPFRDFLQMKEWSFATIVLFGTIIRRFALLKAETQRDITIRFDAAFSC